MLAYDAVRNAYRRFRESGATGADRARVFGIYRELPAMAGLDALYAIEDATTEKKDRS